MKKTKKNITIIQPYQIPSICLLLSVSSLFGIGFATWYDTGGGRELKQKALLSL